MIWGLYPYKMYTISFKKIYVRTQFVTTSKLILGSNAKGPNNKFIKHGYKRTRLTLKEKRLNLTFLNGLQQIFRSISPLVKLSSYFIRFSSKFHLFRISDPFSQCILLCYILPCWCHLYYTRVGWIRGITSCPIQHFLDPLTSSCKATSSLFRYHFHINAARELVKRKLMRR